ncbi:hypothetical protein [Ensifer sp. SSB1]|jgi:hypothetical protein|uniref:hypothetical protein n=1 Tax=Ensifer sp. SSB1 TaxID=2795385 RepID=UPI001A605CE5|nr:hypothetical protein [Ensifer sp. SSB1]MBK5567084.1 hypothetical protein [Ensifer sp. SSB1]
MSAKPSSNVGTKVLFENDKIRIWDFQLEPGQSTELHRHLHDYLFVYVTPDNELSITVPNGKNYVQKSPDGHVGYFELADLEDPQMTHMATNSGKHHHRQIVVELLNTRRDYPPSDK